MTTLAAFVLGLVGWMTLGAAICASIDESNTMYDWASSYTRFGPAVLALCWPLVVWAWYQDISRH